MSIIRYLLIFRQQRLFPQSKVQPICLFAYDKLLDLRLLEQYLYKFISHMEAANLQRKKGWYGNFAIITAILALGHFVGLQYSVSFANEMDDQASKDPDYAPGWYIKQNIPFAAILGLFAIVQFGSSLAILIQHRKQGAAKALYYNALLGLLTSFALGVYFSILASEYNTFGRSYPKDDKTFKSFIPFYYCMQIDAVATFLFTVPMFLFTFYYNLEDYLKEQRETSIQVFSYDTQNKQIWLLTLFLVNSFAHIAFIYNTYQFTDIQQPKNYSLQNIADQYTFYIAVQVFVCLAALIAQVHHFRKPFLRKNQLILIATLVAVFQFGSFIIMSVKAVQFYLDFAIIQNDNCYFLDCAEAKTYRWEILSYSIFTLITLIGQVPYFRIISNIVEKSQTRDTLLTNQEVEK